MALHRDADGSRPARHQRKWAAITFVVTLGTALLCAWLDVLGHPVLMVWLGLFMMFICFCFLAGKMDAILSGIGYAFVALIPIFVTASAAHSSVLDLIGTHTRAVVVSVRSIVTDDDSGATTIEYTIDDAAGHRIPGGALESDSETGSRPDFRAGDHLDVVYDKRGTVAPERAGSVSGAGATWVLAALSWLLLLAVLWRAYVVGRRPNASPKTTVSLVKVPQPATGERPSGTPE